MIADACPVPGAGGFAGRGLAPIGGGRRTGAASVQPRHSSDSLGQLLSVPWSRQGPAQGQAPPGQEGGCTRAGKAFVPGKPDESELVHRIFTDDPDDQMPPAEAHKHLTADQKQMLRRWIAEGAVYEAHWAYLPIQRPPVPNASGPAANDKIRNPIDAFVVARLDAAGLDPAPEADRRTLLRRLSLDLIGLPPSPSQADAFVQDSSPHAYEREVERLLASSHFGERMAVPWLDAVRFADTVGYHGDQNQRIFPYRDYVIKAFNANKPFDRFTPEQIAGDLLPNPSPEQLTASGFNRLNMVTREGGAQPKEYIAKYQADRVRTVSIAWLGSTMACCECHDHKFDPFTTRDFYSMEAFFADSSSGASIPITTTHPIRNCSGFTNDHPFPPRSRWRAPTSNIGWPSSGTGSSARS